MSKDLYMYVHSNPIYKSRNSPRASPDEWIYNTWSVQQNPKKPTFGSIYIKHPEQVNAQTQKVGQPLLGSEGGGLGQ